MSVEEAPPGKTPKLTWSERTEELLAAWCDVGRCFTWLHEKSFRKFSKSHYHFSIPIIVLSTITGTASVAMSGYVPAEYITYAQLAVGGINIFTGILSTLQNFFRSAQCSESHSNAHVGWSKLCRNIEIELTLERDKRRNANDFVKICRSEYDRLLEQSPVIPSAIIKKFKKNIFTNPDLILPNILGDITHTKIYRGFKSNSTSPSPRSEIDSTRRGVLDEVKTVIEKVRETQKFSPPLSASFRASRAHGYDEKKNDDLLPRFVVDVPEDL